LRSVWKLAWPTVLLNVVNGSSGVVDQILVGKYVDYHGNAAIGVAWQTFLVIIVFLSSLFNGMGVLVARYAGKQDSETVSTLVYETFLTSLLLQFFIVAPIGYMISPTLLRWVNAEPAVAEHALGFLRIMFTCSMPLFAMFMLTGALQAAGNPKTPLVLGILTTGLNIVLSTMFITGFGPLPQMGASGAALGTCLSPLPSVVIALYLIHNNALIIRKPKRMSLIPDFRIIKEIARIGIPTGIQAVLLNIGGWFLLRYIGALEHSAEAQAAYTICYSQLFSFITWTSFGLRAASSTIISQNIGAGDTARGKRGVYVTTSIGIVWAVALGLLFLFVPHALLKAFFVEDELVIRLGTDFLAYLSVSGVFLACALSLTGGLQGAGDTKTPMYIAFVTQIGILLGICEVCRRLGILTPHIIWIAILVSHSTRFAITWFMFQRGGWVSKRVEIAT
jgi:putative MATE family efflux protein